MKLFHGAAAATISLLVLAASACAQGLPALGHLPPAVLTPHTQWIAGSVKEMETIKVGMTRAQLLKCFTRMPGESSHEQVSNTSITSAPISRSM